jgi:hypothetical protein
MNKDWRSIRYEEKYDWDQIPRPIKPIPVELQNKLLLPGDNYTIQTSYLHTRPFSDNSVATLNRINKDLEALRVKLEYWGLHYRTNLLIYSFKPIERKNVKVKNPWYNFILVWSLGDLSPDDWFLRVFWCARISEEYYGQKGIHMNLKKRSQRWFAKHKGKSKRRRLMPSKNSGGNN